jgi:AraC-like DNA-binding protein
MMTVELKPRSRAAGGPQGEKDIVALLAESAIYRDYERAFVAGTGLPLRLHAPEMLTVIRPLRKQENPFCTLMAEIPQWCTACYLLQRELEQKAQFASKTLSGFAGLCETAVPVRIGDLPVAFLHTGEVLLHQPEKSAFNTIARTLVAWGSKIDLKKAEEFWFNSRVIPARQYEALVHLIEIFAHHLANSSNGLILNHQKYVHPEISKARKFITEHCSDEISLAVVARVVGMSPNYFSGKFTEATGIHFVEYVTRLRIEKARELLQNPNLRVSEIAFDVGFQSISQFNRTFKRVTGHSPRECRAEDAAK